MKRLLLKREAVETTMSIKFHINYLQELNIELLAFLNNVSYAGIKATRYTNMKDNIQAQFVLPGSPWDILQQDRDSL